MPGTPFYNSFPNLKCLLSPSHNKGQVLSFQIGDSVIYCVIVYPHRSFADLSQLFRQSGNYYDNAFLSYLVNVSCGPQLCETFMGFCSAFMQVLFLCEQFQIHFQGTTKYTPHNGLATSRTASATSGQVSMVTMTK